MGELPAYLVSPFGAVNPGQKPPDRIEVSFNKEYFHFGCLGAEAGPQGAAGVGRRIETGPKSCQFHDARHSVANCFVVS
jgi:hypothetical protein